MLLVRLALENVGVYKGRAEFDMSPEPGRPVVLYGGTNGAGKTTLFESIPLCLYGRDYGGGDDRPTLKRYHDRIRRLFHRDTATHTSARDASITLEFQYSQNGRITQYAVTRTWYNEDGKVVESLGMQKKNIGDGTPEYVSVKEDEVYLQSVINRMIPKNIAKMFIFDGERIQDIANSGNENSHIKSSFDGLLGLDIPVQLRDDMGLYIIRNSDADTEEVATRLEQQNVEKKETEAKLEQTMEKRVFLESEIGRMHKDLAALEDKFFGMGGHFAKERRNLTIKKMDIEQHISGMESGLRTLVERHLALMIIPDQLREVQKEIGSDATIIGNTFTKNAVESAFDGLRRDLDDALCSHDAKTRNEVIRTVEAVMDARLKSIPFEQKPIFDFSLSNMHVMMEKIDSVLNDDSDYDQIAGIHTALKNHLQKLRDIEAKLDVAPQQDEIGPIYTEIKNTALGIGEMEQELQTLKNIEAQERSMIVMINSRIRKLLDQKRAGSKMARGLEMAPRIQAVLDDYAGRLRTRKIKLLESNILNGIQNCFHKDWLITRISIDPQTYEVSLYGENDDEVRREQLSQGELQMYATAIVWGLARTSGRPLPFVIDTPLARLDDGHREKLIRNFYPKASHQTVIFSTDTEITGQYLDMLSPHVARAMMVNPGLETDGGNNGNNNGGGTTAYYFGDATVAGNEIMDANKSEVDSN